MDYELLDVIRPLLIMGGAMVLVLLCKELHQGWMETVNLRRLRQRTQKATEDEKEADQE